MKRYVFVVPSFAWALPWASNRTHTTEVHTIGMTVVVVEERGGDERPRLGRLTEDMNQ
jgi:hypothetical protein